MSPATTRSGRIQAQENAREPLSLRDQQEQFRDCWQARAGLPDADRIAVVCADLGITTGKGHSLRRQLALPEAIRDRTVVENEHVYAVRIDDGVLLDGAEQVEHARNHLTAERHAEAAAALGCEAEKLDSELDALAARAKSSALKLRVDATLRDRAANGRYGWVFERGQDFAAGIWVIDPVFMLDAVRHQLADADGEVAREEAYFGGARLDDDELRDAAEEDRQRRAAERARHAEAAASNLTLGHDIRAALADPSDDQLARCARSSAGCF